MKIDVPIYTEKGFVFAWEEGFLIRCTINDYGVCIEANKEGLISLAKHMLELAQEDVPEFEHIHLDKYNSLEDNSAELTIVKRKEFK